MKRFSQFVAVLLAVCLTVTNVMGQSAASAVRPEPKAAVGNVGTGEKARVTVKLKDGSELRGYVSRTGEQDFGITDRKTLQEKTVAYGDVIAIKSKNESWDYGVRARKEVSKAGIGTHAHVNLTSHNGAKIKGYVVQASEDRFVVANRKTGDQTTLAYSDVATINRGVSRAAKIGLGAGLGFAVVVALFAAAYLANE